MEAADGHDSAERSTYSLTCPEVLHMCTACDMHQTPLPADVIRQTMTFLDPRDLLSVSVISKDCQSIIDEEVMHHALIH